MRGSRMRTATCGGDRPEEDATGAGMGFARAMSLHLAYVPMFDLFRRKQRAPFDAANVAARAADLLRQGRYPDALAAFDGLLTADPANIDGLVGRRKSRFAVAQPAKTRD